MSDYFSKYTCHLVKDSQKNWKCEETQKLDSRRKKGIIAELCWNCCKSDYLSKGSKKHPVGVQRIRIYFRNIQSI